MTRSRWIVIAAALALVGCAPRARSLEGVVAPDRTLPVIELAPGHRRLVFRWDYEENALIARGDTVYDSPNIY